MTSAAVGLTVLAGLAGSIQVAVMGRFGGRIGVIVPVAIAFAGFQFDDVSILG